MEPEDVASRSASVTAGPPLPAWRRARRVVLLAAAICLVPAAVSWVGAMSGHRNVGIDVATVEWVRSHGGNPIVSEVENAYYTLTAPAKGGPALKQLPQVGVADAEAEAEPAPHVYRPQPIEPLIISLERPAQHVQVLLELRERAGREATRSLGSLHALHDQPRLRQHADVARDGRLRDRKRLGELIHRRFSEREPRQDAPPRRVREGGQSLV